MRDPDPRDTDSLARNQGHAQKTGPGSNRGSDGMTGSTPDRPSNELSGTAGTFVAALFAVILLAALFIRLSYHLQSHWKAAAVIGTGFGLWLLVAALLRLKTSGPARLLAALGSAAIVVGFGFALHAYLGWEGLKWALIVVAGFYVLKLVFDLLERFSDSVIVKIAIWAGLGVGAILLFFWVGA